MKSCNREDVSNILFKLLKLKPLPSNEELFQLISLFRQILLGHSHHVETLSILSTLTKELNIEEFFQLIRLHLFTPIFYILRKNKTKNQIIEYGLEIILQFLFTIRKIL